MVGRYELSDAQWDRIKDLLPGKVGDPGRSGKDNRLFVNGVLWVLRSGAPWPDLPERYGKWKSVHTRFSRWAKKGVWEHVFKLLTADRKTRLPHARQHFGSRPPAGRDWKRGACDQALGRSRGGLTTKIHMLADALGRPLSFALTAGQVHDVIAAPELIKGIAGDAIIADKAYDSSSLRQLVTEAGMLAIIPSTRSRKLPIPHDRIGLQTA